MELTHSQPDEAGQDPLNSIVEIDSGAKMKVGDTAKTGDRMSAVLLLDDNAIQAATRQTILKRAGHFAIAALNPRRVLEQFRGDEFPAEIRLVVTDHIMPEMTGSEFVRELRKTHPNLPVMVISGLEEAMTEYVGLNVRFLLKPLPPETMLENVRDLIAGGEEAVA
jgi:DNA-binding NtrC family response regulator